MRKFRTLILGLLMLSSISVAGVIVSLDGNLQAGRVLSEVDTSVTVIDSGGSSSSDSSASPGESELGNCIMSLVVYPENRLPLSNNWSTTLFVDIYDSTSSNLLARITGNSNSQGILTYDVCEDGVDLGPGLYDIYVRGISHLRRKFDNVPAFSQYEFVVNLATVNKPLIPGETSIVFDNYINSLDLSTQVGKLYTGDPINDLNQDGLVNSLDLSLTLRNLYTQGE